MALASRVFRAFPSVVLAALLLAGCSGREKVKQGEQLMASGDRDGAVAAMRQAVAEDPTNADYAMQLSDAETVAAEEHLAKAQSLLRDGKVEEGRAELQKTLDFTPGDPQAVTMLAQLDSGVDPGVVAATPSPAQRGVTRRKTEQERQIASSDGEARPAAAAAQPLPADTERLMVQAEPKPASPEPQPFLGNDSASSSNRHPAAPRPVPAIRKRPVASRPAAIPHMDRRPALAPMAPPPPPLSGDSTFRAVVSRDDKRYPKEMDTVDGIHLKVKDTSKNPLTADIEITVAGVKKRYDNLRVGTRINGRGISRSPCQLFIEGIVHETDTVHFMIVPMVPLQ